MGKLKVFQAAKQLNLSSEGLIAVLTELKFPKRGYTSYITEEEFEAAKQRLRKEKKQFKEHIRKRRAPRPAQRPQPQQTERDISKSIKRTMVKVRGRQIRHKKPVRETRAACEESSEHAVGVSDYMTVAELAHAFETTASEVIKKCIKLGLLATVNQRLDIDTIMLIADECGIRVEQEAEAETQEVERGEAEHRPPVVVVLGHVDHGKTALLDYIRKTKVVEQEAGRITQHTGAYVAHYDDKPIVFLDTPGHEAFTAMRARGAQVTDIAVLVVAADDGVMPQTKEAIDHARAAGIPMIVAITKSDLANANADRVKTQLSQQGVSVEGYGGETLCVETSAMTGQGVEELLDAISVKSLELDLKASYDGPAEGVVLEARVDRGRGNIATVLIQQGTLHKGDPFVAAEFSGRVRELMDENFNRVDDVSPSMPVQVLGFAGLPQAGDRFDVVEDERSARELAQKRYLSKRDRLLSATKPKVTLESLQDQIAEGQIRELRIVLKADVSGSAEALRDSLEGLSIDEVRVRVIHTGVGNISKGDVLLAQASEAIIVGFHIRALPDAKTLADQEGIEIRTYRIIYAAIDDIRAAMLGLLEPEKREVPLGRAEIRKVFSLPRGTILGSYITEGKVTRDAFVRVVHDGEETIKTKVVSLKRFKDDVKDVDTGFECGIGVEEAEGIEEGDTLEFFVIEEVARASPASRQ